MSDSELAVVVAHQTFPTPVLIERAGPSTRKKFFEFFSVPIRNANTRAAYYRAIQQFLSWCERAGYQDLHGGLQPLQQRVHPAAAHPIRGWLPRWGARDSLQVPSSGDAAGRRDGRAAADRW